MIGFAVRQPDLEDRTEAIDGPGRIQLLHHLLNDTQASGRHGLHTISEFVPNRRWNNHRGLAAPVGFVDPAHHSTLASRQFVPHSVLHSKTSCHPMFFD